ncbi:sensor histidine kinase [Pseudalkalibacillus caeni]|nr:ATP-binding protein [Pseudalkalibacillus caeni]
MIKKTKKRLMWIFAILTMLFLLLFVVIAYIAVSNSILSDQKEKAIEMISNKSVSHLIHEANEPYERTKGSLLAVVTPTGEIVHRHGESIDNIIKGWTPDSLESREIDEDNREYLFVAKPIEAGGYVYSGVDITQQKEVLNRLFTVLILLTVLFTFAAMGLSFLMAGKAIGPIINSFKRQREFVNDASHELRTPLSILSAGLEILEEEEENHLSEFSRQTVNDMSAEVRRMTSLVNDLLLLARSDSGKLVLVKEKFDLSGLVSRSVRAFSKVVQDNGLSITSEIQENVHMSGDRERIQQVIYLFLDNAVKYNQKNGTIHVRLTSTEKKVYILVKDSGIGIPPEHLTKIFERFYRVDKARSRNLGSNGIGLSIARFIVEAHGGNIEVNSTVGEGTSFLIVLYK